MTLIGRDVNFTQQDTPSGAKVTTGQIVDTILREFCGASATYYIVCVNEAELIVVAHTALRGFEKKLRQIPIKGGSVPPKPYDIPYIPIMDLVNSNEPVIAISETGFSYYCKDGRIVSKNWCAYDIPKMESEPSTHVMITLSLPEKTITEEYLLERGYGQRSGDGSVNKTCIRICPSKKWFWYGNYSVMPSVMPYHEY